MVRELRDKESDLRSSQEISERISVCKVAEKSIERCWVQMVELFFCGWNLQETKKRVTY